MGNLANTRRANWDVKWNAADLGYVDDVHPDLQLMFEPIKVGSIGAAILGQRFTGLEGLIKIQLREVTRATLEKLMPWAAGGGAAIDISPPINTDLYIYSQVLLLHPTDMGVTTSQDLNLLKTVPIQ